MKLHPAILNTLTLPPPVRLAIVILATIALGLMAGCASLTQAGNSGYSIQRATTPDGKTTTGYNLSIQDGKEYAARTVTFSATPTGSVTFTVSEQGTKAFPGQGIAAKALNVFPVTGLADILTAP